MNDRFKPESVIGMGQNMQIQHSTCNQNLEHMKIELV